MAVIYLLRHGQASFGADDYDRLSPMGHRQATRLGQALAARGVQPTRAVGGTLMRHRETAAGTLAGMGVQPGLPLHEHPGVNEFDHEDVVRVAEPRYADRLVMMAELAASGDPRRAFQQFFRGAVGRWVAAEHAHEYVEPWAVFKRRCLDALDELVRSVAPKDQVLVFTSGGPISVICAHLLGLPDARAFAVNWTLANAGITKLVVGRDGTHLISVNEHAHLEAEAGMLTYR